MLHQDRQVSRERGAAESTEPCILVGTSWHPRTVAAVPGAEHRGTGRTWVSIPQLWERARCGGLAAAQSRWRQMVLPGQVPALLPSLPQADSMSEVGNGTLTTHVLNTATGLPAAGLVIRLAQLQEPGPQWKELAQR